MFIFTAGAVVPPSPLQEDGVYGDVLTQGGSTQQPADPAAPASELPAPAGAPDLAPLEPGAISREPVQLQN